MHPRIAASNTPLVTRNQQSPTKLVTNVRSGTLKRGRRWLCHAAFDASQLPEYRPQTPVSGVIRNYGFGFGGLLKIWEEGFRKHHPDVTFQDVLITSDAAFPAMVTGTTDLAPDGGEPALTEWPGTAIDPKLREFLRYVLSREDRRPS